jgi:hypothetical protein
MGLVWQLNQDGERIKGSSRIFGEEWTTDEGSVVGTVAGSSFTFSESHAAGTVTGCTAQLQGTLTFKSVSDRPQNPPSRYWQNAPEPPQPRESLTGRISGHACDGPVDVVVVLFRD